MRTVDLSTPIDAELWEPDEVTHENMSPAQGARHWSRW